MNNLEIYNKMRAVPAEAKKPIQAGRLKGKTDINPMWRIKALTDTFGACGVGWGYVIKRFWTEDGIDGEKCAFCEIGLWYRDESGEKSDLIPGIGGNMMIQKETKGMYVNDECYKMALTDAISVAAKALGCGADVYWEADSTKYNRAEPAQMQIPQPQKDVFCSICGEKIKPVRKSDGTIASPEEVAKVTEGLCMSCYKLVQARDAG